MKNIFLLCACLLALAAPLRAAAVPPADIVVVRAYEGMGRITVIITRGEGKSEKVTFDRGVSDKSLLASSEGYYKVFQQLYQEGYALQNSFATPRDSEAGFTTFLFTKSH